jgi:hypothetical protein
MIIDGDLVTMSEDTLLCYIPVEEVRKTTKNLGQDSRSGLQAGIGTGDIPLTKQMMFSAIRAGRGFELTALSGDVQRMFSARIALALKKVRQAGNGEGRFLCARSGPRTTRRRYSAANLVQQGF